MRIDKQYGTVSPVVVPEATPLCVTLASLFPPFAMPVRAAPVGPIPLRPAWIFVLSAALAAP